jgi:ATP-dependent Clp endopeptidase proteolytic subunit ClpP
MKKWFKIENKADKAEIWIYEQIGEDWWTGGGMTAKSFQKELATITAGQIDLHINSPGGDVFDGITIYNLLKQHKATITTYIDGLAASIASVIALAGDQVIMAENALMMIHNAWGAAMGDADVMRKMAETLDKVSGSIILAYTEKTGKDAQEMAQMMADETWFTAAEALDMGFADQIAEKMDMAACAKFIPAMEKAKFKHIPDEIAGMKQVTDESGNMFFRNEKGEFLAFGDASRLREIADSLDNAKQLLEEIVPKQNEPKRRTHSARSLERILRDGGCSDQMAKAIIAEGYKGDRRDVAPAADQRDVAAPESLKIVAEDDVQDLLFKSKIMRSQGGKAR